MLGCFLASHTWENPYLCILRRGTQPGREISIFRTGSHRSRRWKWPNSYDISDLPGILTSRLEWPEAQISVGIPLRHTVVIGTTAFRTRPNRRGLKFWYGDLDTGLTDGQQLYIIAVTLQNRTQITSLAGLGFLSKGLAICNFLFQITLCIIRRG